MLYNHIIVLVALLLVFPVPSRALAKIKIESDVTQDSTVSENNKYGPPFRKYLSIVSRNASTPNVSGPSRVNAEQKRLGELVDIQIEALQPYVDQETQMMIECLRSKNHHLCPTAIYHQSLLNNILPSMIRIMWANQL